MGSLTDDVLLMVTGNVMPAAAVLVDVVEYRTTVLVTLAVVRLRSVVTEERRRVRRVKRWSRDIKHLATDERMSRHLPAGIRPVREVEG